ncbi:calcium-activated chloride channel regulator 1-like [Gastrophryne carolinensis]
MAILAVLALLGLQIFCPAKSSMVKVTEGGYDDIVIAIHPEVPEDTSLIENIKQMIQEASHDLYHATSTSLFIRSAKILIPRTWSNKGEYSNRSREEYEKADVIVANTFLNIGDSPYTKQYGGCGEKGQYIHFTPDFLLQEDLISGYGPRGKVFVHEWAHLRWGVFEEYSTEQPFYISGNLQVEATRCTVNVSGLYRVPVHLQDSCLSKICDFDPDTGVYETGCVFFPEKNQIATESIMYYPGLQSITHFCTEDNHNMEAPTMQNRMCNCRSTWDVIKESSDITQNPRQDNENIPADVNFSLLQYEERRITIAIDVSSSMTNNDRLNRVHQAADIFLTEIASGVHVGIVETDKFSQLSKSRYINSDYDREWLRNELPVTVSPYGPSDFCSGISKAFEINQDIFGSLRGTEILIMADSEDLRAVGCIPEIKASGAIIHTIAIGLDAPQLLGEISDMTGGLKYFASDNLESNDLIDAFIGVANRNGDTSPRINQLESKSLTVEAGDCFNGSVLIDSTVGAHTSFNVIWQSVNPSIQLQDPKGHIYSFTIIEESHLSRVKIAEEVTKGNWTYNICNTFSSSQILGLVVTSKASVPAVPAITVDVHMNREANIYPSSMIVYATVSQGLIPVKGAKVTAAITPENGMSTFLDLLDNGAGADIAKDDGIYSRFFFNFTKSGRYNVKVRVEGEDGECWLTYPRGRALNLQGFVENGKVVLNTLNQQNNEILPPLGPFTRTSAGSSFTVSDVNDASKHIYPPGDITDLEAQTKDDEVILSWTATGDQLDQGTAQSYVLRINTTIKDLRDNFEGSTEVTMSYAPSLAVCSSIEQTQNASAYVVQLERSKQDFFGYVSIAMYQMEEV